MTMKLVVCLALIVCYTNAIEYTLENCKCGDHYEARQDDHGKVSCFGKMLLHIKPCNLPEAPRCICTKDKVNGIMTDAEGTWCTFSEAGVQKKKWPCENTDAWDAYKIEYANYEKTLHQ